MEATNRNSMKKVGIVAIIVIVAILLALLVPTFMGMNKLEKQLDSYQKETNEQLADLKNKIENCNCLTAEQLQAKIAEEIKKYHDANPGGITEEQIAAIVDAVMAKIPQAPAGLTQAQVKKLIADALKKVDTLTEEEVKKMIADALANLGGGEEEEDTRPLKEKLEAGGIYSLTGNVALDGVAIARNVTSALDLKGYTLTVGDEWTVDGNLTVTNGTIVIEKPEDEEKVYMESGLCVGAGTLKLDSVNIIGKRLWNIENNGTLYLTNAKYTVNGGYGITNSGAAVVNGCVLVANGEATSQIYNKGGAMNVVASELVEGSNFVSYYYAGAVESHFGGTVTLDNTKVTTGADQYSMFAGSSGNIVVNSGTISNKVFCLPGATCVVNGGTINGVAFADITAESEIFVGVGCKLTQGENCWIISE